MHSGVKSVPWLRSNMLSLRSNGLLCMLRTATPWLRLLYLYGGAEGGNDTISSGARAARAARACARGYIRLGPELDRRRHGLGGGGVPFRSSSGPFRSMVSGAAASPSPFSDGLPFISLCLFLGFFYSPQRLALSGRRGLCGRMTIPIGAGCASPSLALDSAVGRCTRTLRAVCLWLMGGRAMLHA